VSDAVRAPVLRPVGDQRHDVFQRETRGAILELGTDPFSRAREHTVSLSATTTSLAHGLGRRFKRWVVVDKTSSADVWRDETSTADLTQFLPLVATGPVQVTILVE
jgi:hypothetical protein